MANDTVERIKEVRKALNLNQTDFGNNIGYGRDVIGNIESRRVEPKPLLLQQICKVYNVDPDWLETGEGDMFLQGDPVTDLVGFAENLFTNPDLSWLRTLCEYINELTPDEQAAAARHIRSLANRLATEKEQEN